MVFPAKTAITLWFLFMLQNSVRPNGAQLSTVKFPLLFLCAYYSICLGFPLSPLLVKFYSSLNPILKCCLPVKTLPKIT